MDVQVELRPMFAKQTTPLGVVDIETEQLMVLASTGRRDRKVHIAYICKHPGSPFNGLPGFRDFPQSIKDEIVAKTIEQMNWPADTGPRSVNEPPPPMVIDLEDE